MPTTTPPTMAGTPLAFFITFTTYGSWLHGDPRGWVDRSRLPDNDARRGPHARIHGQRREETRSPAVTLDARMRECVRRAIRETCETAGWTLASLAVRRTHAHVLATSDRSATQTLSCLKGQATRALRSAALVETGRRVWTRQGSTKYLWTRRSVIQVQHYIEAMQDHPDVPMPWYGHGE